MKKTITIVLILALLSIGLQSTASETIDYDVTIIPIMDFSVESVNSSFGTMQPHTDKAINPTFVVNNTKSACDLLMSARFTTERNGIYGLVSDIDVISADRFNLSSTIRSSRPYYWEWLYPDIFGNLHTEGIFENISIIHAQTINPHRIYINISADQEIGVYNGTIELIFEEHY